MYPRTEYEMTQADFDTLMEAMKPVPYMIIGGSEPRSQQENANDAWALLGAKMGFDYNTVQPISGKGQLWFSAVPNEHDDVRKERLAREAEAALKAKIFSLQSEISERQQKLSELLAM